MIPIESHTRTTENIFTSIFDQISEGILIIDEYGYITEVNSFFLRVSGYKDDEIIGRPIAQYITYKINKPEMLAGNGSVKNIQFDAAYHYTEMLLYLKNGEKLPVNLRSYKTAYEQKNYVTLFVMPIDILNKSSDKYTMEETVQHRTRELSRTLRTLELLNEKLETSLSYQKAILDNANVMLYMMNSRGLIKYFNPEAERITGYKSTEIINVHSPVVFHKPEEILYCKNELTQKYCTDFSDDFSVIVKKINDNNNQSIECEYIKKDGTTIPVMISIKPVFDRTGKISGYLGLTVDISERKQTENKLIDALNKEKNLGELKSRFVAMASHEFRTPLSTVMSSAYLISKYNKTEDQSKREKHLNRIISSVNMLTDILNEFLSVGKIEEGKVSVKLAEFDLKVFMNELIMYIQNTAKKGQKFIYEHLGNPIVIIDPSILKSVLINILSNAIKFSSENQDIMIATISDAEELIIKVSDSGIGISEEDQQYLMQRFFRAANATNIQGTGLGLHIVSRYVEKMNGTIKFKSELNKGTTFTIRFDARMNKRLLETQETKAHT